MKVKMRRSVLLVAILVTLSISLCVSFNSRKRARLHRFGVDWSSRFFLSPEEEQDLLVARDELISLSKSFSPLSLYRSYFLDKLVANLENKKKAEIEEKRRAEEVDDKRKKEETKLISIQIFEGDEVGDLTSINREIFQKWVGENKYLIRDRKPEATFEGIVPGESYQFVHRVSTQRF